MADLFSNCCYFSRQTFFSGMLGILNRNYLHYFIHYHSPKRTKNYLEIEALPASGLYNPCLRIALSHFQNRVVIFGVPWEQWWFWLI